MNVETAYVEDAGGQTVERKVVKLFDRNDGSYFYPSPSSTAEHCIEFWSNVTISDEIIAQA